MKRCFPIPTLLLAFTALTVPILEGGDSPVSMEDEVTPGLFRPGRDVRPIVHRLKSLGNPVYLCIVWNQRQSIRESDPPVGDGQAVWESLLDTGDHYRLFTLLDEYPKLCLTVSLSPLLLEGLKEASQSHEGAEPAQEPSDASPTPNTARRKGEETQTELTMADSLISVFRKLQKEGRLEIVASPTYDPVLPLICDTDVAKASMPHAPLPQRFSFPADAEAHLRRAVRLHREIFRESPWGILPAGGSVSGWVIPLVSSSGVRWLVSDQGVLASSLTKLFLAPKDLCRPYGLGQGVREPFIVFANSYLSSVISGEYKSLGGIVGVNAFLERLYEIHAQSADWEVPALVVVVLQENGPRERFGDGGYGFFEFLVSQLSRADWVKTSTVREYLSRFPPKRVIGNLWPSSTVNRDFSLWIGEEEENLAWEYLLEARTRVEEARGVVSDEKIELAMEYVYAAEGSDWFRWYGEDGVEKGGQFDKEYRTVLRNIYQMLGFPPPSYLNRTILSQASPIVEEEPGKLLFSVHDPEGDDRGPGTYTYPGDESFSPGVFDLLRFGVRATEEELVFLLEFRELSNPWGAPLGFSHKLIDIYLSTRTGEKSFKKTYKKGANVRFDQRYPWNFFVRAAGWPRIGKMVYSAEEELVGRPEVSCDPEMKTVRISVPRSLVGDPEGSNWAYYVLIGSEDGLGQDQYRPIDKTATRWTGGGNAEGPKAPRIYDMLDPASNGKTQRDMLGSFNPKKGELAIIHPVVLH